MEIGAGEAQARRKMWRQPRHKAEETSGSEREHERRGRGDADEPEGEVGPGGCGHGEHGQEHDCGHNDGDVDCPAPFRSRCDEHAKQRGRRDVARRGQRQHGERQRREQPGRRGEQCGGGIETVRRHDRQKAGGREPKEERQRLAQHDAGSDA